MFGFRPFGKLCKGHKQTKLSHAASVDRCVVQNNMRRLCVVSFSLVNGDHDKLSLLL